MRNKKNQGFSLIELLIVVAIILIIAAIAIPNLLRARISANETSAVASLRTINTTAVQYAATYPAAPGACGFPAALVNLGGPPPATPAAADLIDAVLKGGSKNGYNFALVGASADANGCLQSFGADAVPVNVGTTGQRSFCVDNTGVVRFNTTGAAIGTGVGVCAAVPNVLQ